MSGTLLTINSGSSSLKLGLYTMDTGAPSLLLKGTADGIGKPGGSLQLKDAKGKLLHQEDAEHESQPEAFEHAAKRLAEVAGDPPAAVGHRVVHGGPRLREHCAITPQVLEDLHAATHYAPLHIPPALALIDAATRSYPQAQQFACFDTAFHRTLPAEAATLAVPAHYRAQGVQRYGFHGLSYESIVHALGDRVPRRLIVAHLGNGASLCAIAEGRSVDTSMGFTPTGGIPMGTRTGDLDPGVVLFLARDAALRSSGVGGVSDVDAIESLLNHDSGLKALSSIAESPGTSDMRELTKAADGGDAQAALAIRIFCRAIAKTIAAYCVVLNGLDCLVFTGGIGEHSAVVRRQVGAELRFLGVQLDNGANDRHAEAIASEASPVQVRVMPAEEDDQIARHVIALLAGAAH